MTPPRPEVQRPTRGLRDRLGASRATPRRGRRPLIGTGLLGAGLLGTALVLVALPVCAADIHKGAELYRQHCAACHGGDGLPVVAGATDFARPTALLKPDLALLAVIRSGKGAMPAFQGQLRDREMADIVAHLRTRR